MQQLDKILERLVECKVEFVLVGGLAAMVHSAPVMTEDVDICLSFTRENLDRLVEAVRDLHPRHRLTAQRLPFEINDRNWSAFKNIYLTLDWGILDCLGEVLGIGPFVKVMEESELLPFDFGNCRVLSIGGLIRAKEAVGRPHDMKTVGYLRAILEKRQKAK